jgi:hypothetical protein
MEKEMREEQFNPTTYHPLRFAIERALFKKKQLQRLLAAARQIKGVKKTVQTRITRWQRHLDRLERVPARISGTHTLLLNPAPQVKGKWETSLTVDRFPPLAKGSTSKSGLLNFSTY